VPASEGGEDQIAERALSKPIMVHCPLPAFSSVIQSGAKVLQIIEKTEKRQY
jgi:hypothetical protein